MVSRLPAALATLDAMVNEMRARKAEYTYAGDSVWLDHTAVTYATVMAAADEIRAALVAEIGGWRPIDSAPRDGTHIIAWCRRGSGQTPQCIAPVWWCRPADLGGTGDAAWVYRTSVGLHFANPTYWQPLPKPPAVERVPAVAP